MGIGTKTVLKRRITSGGYVLIEVMVSLVVFSVGILSVMRSFSVATRARGVAQDYTVAAFLCQKLMSESQSMADLPEGAETGGFGDAYPKFNWTRTVTLIKIEPPPPPKQDQKPRRGRVFQGHVLQDAAERRRAMSGPQKTLTLRGIVVTVSWSRRGAQYSVSAETRLPVREGAISNVGA